MTKSPVYGYADYHVRISFMNFENQPEIYAKITPRGSLKSEIVEEGPIPDEGIFARLKAVSSEGELERAQWELANGLSCSGDGRVYETSPEFKDRVSLAVTRICNSSPDFYRRTFDVCLGLQPVRTSQRSVTSSGMREPRHMCLNKGRRKNRKETSN